MDYILFTISTFRDTEYNLGLYSYFDFIDVVNLKRCCKYLNNKITLPPILKIDINKNNLEHVQNILKNYNQYIKTVVLSQEVACQKFVIHIIGLCPCLKDIIFLNAESKYDRDYNMKMFAKLITRDEQYYITKNPQITYFKMLYKKSFRS